MTTESAQAQRIRGRLARKAIPRKALGEFTALDRDPAAMIQRRDEGRLARLVPLRHQRMSASEFAFFRGSAGLMAHDLALQAQTDTQLVICGDAHINNFGLYASPERRLMFDLNDFDEAAPGPWEWDVKRLLTSAILAAKEIGASPDEVADITQNGARTYRTVMQEMLAKPALERHYVSVDSTTIAASVREGGLRGFTKTTQKARKRDADRTIAHLMTPDRMGFLRFKDDPPILTHTGEMSQRDFEELFLQYRDSALSEIGFLLSRYEITDVAMRVVGVGSVGTRCYLVALTGPEGNGMVLQIKEAGESVVTHFSEPNMTTPQTLTKDMSGGDRVVTHQRILQAVSDPFLGHIVQGGRSYYVRQYRDAKGSFDTTTMDVETLKNYVRLCATLLARAHSQSPYAHWVGGYIGDTDAFDVAILSWCTKYSEQVSRDYRRYLEAIEDGTVSVAMEEPTT